MPIPATPPAIDAWSQETTPEERMRVIMENIIKNKGRFKPTKVMRRPDSA